MTKNYKKTSTSASTGAGSKSKSTSSAQPKSKSALEQALELFPSPPHADGTPDPERILEKKRREAAEAAAKDKSGAKK
ncbi:MAG: hypothetical protein ALECFALPRED_004563 [Alectoria fallacina]|uniref:Uncharacterized protein n=1 Tax=Alectoria fallacina TaxID=1903189 RepID=A0A8H3FUH4_9LECA|nr:MAG: hypothetical protein ALECFALPRED_004563 [Alectoria fallacina]